MYCVITRFIAQGVDREACTAQGKAECCIRIETPPRVQYTPMVHETCSTLKVQM